MKKSSFLRGVTYSAITLLGVSPFLASAADGLFGDYFQRMIGTGPCVTGYVLVGFDGTPGSYGTKTCIAFSYFLGNPVGSVAPVGQAVIGFSSTGVLRFGSVNWIRNTPNNISYTDGNVGIGTVTPTARLDVSGGDAIIHGITVGRGSGSIDSNTALGAGTLYSNTIGINNSAIGVNALRSNTVGNGNTADGVNALRSNTTGYWNTANGGDALMSNTIGNLNTANGAGALRMNTTGSGNTAEGYHALYSNTTGNYNTTLGVRAGYSLTTGSNNIVIGYNAQLASTTASNQLTIGNWLYGSGGNIGIGTTNPLEKLHITGGSLLVQTGSVSVSSGNINLKRGIIALDYDDNADLGFITEAGLGGIGFAGNQGRLSRPDLYVTHQGRTGIGGITTPRTMLDVNGEIVATNRLTLAQNTGSTSPTWHVDNSSDTFRIFRQPNISTAGTAFVHVSSLGNVGIGTSIGLARLDVRGTTGNQTTLRVSSSDGSSVASTWPSGWSGIQTWDILSRNTKVDRLQLGNKVILSAVGDAHGNDNWIRMLSVANPNDYGNYGIAAGKLWAAGEIYGREFIYTSDVRLKKNIETLAQSEDTIMSLRGVRFDWKDSGESDIGFIAQEIETVLPELVDTNSDGYKAVKYGNITAILVEALKNQIEKNRTQEQEIKNLEKRLELIEARLQ